MYKEKNLPKQRTVQDNIFKESMTRIKSFPTYLTGLDDFVSDVSNNHIDDAFKNITTGSAKFRSNGKISCLEHHSSISYDLLLRSNNYISSIAYNYNCIVDPVIFYTGDLPVTQNFINISSNMQYAPKWVCSKHFRGDVILNSLKYKIMCNDTFDEMDILNLVWLPTFSSNKSIEDIVSKSAVIYSKAQASNYLLDFARDCISLWASKYLNDNYNKKTLELLI